MIIGDRLRIVREEKKLSQADLEERTGIPRTHISRIENGHDVPSLGTVEQLAEGLGVPIYELFVDPSGPPPFPPLIACIDAQMRSLPQPAKTVGLFAWIRARLAKLQ